MTKTKVYSLRIYTAMEAVIFTKYTSFQCLITIIFLYTKVYVSSIFYLMIKPDYLDLYLLILYKVSHNNDYTLWMLITLNLMGLFVSVAVCEELWTGVGNF